MTLTDMFEGHFGNPLSNFLAPLNTNDFARMVNDSWITCWVMLRTNKQTKKTNRRSQTYYPRWPTESAWVYAENVILDTAAKQAFSIDTTINAGRLKHAVDEFCFYVDIEQDKKISVSPASHIAHLYLVSRAHSRRPAPHWRSPLWHTSAASSEGLGSASATVFFPAWRWCYLPGSSPATQQNQWSVCVCVLYGLRK